MSYCKVLVDNPNCSRHFHITYDDEAAKQGQVELRCPFCDVVIFHKDNHPPVKIAREENLTKTTNLSENLIADCAFKDNFGEKTIPHA